MTAGLPARPAVAVHADAGRFAYDTMTLVGPGTFAAVLAAVDCAAAAADPRLGRRRRSPTRSPARPATTRPRPATAAPATSTTPPSPPRCCGPAARPRWASSTSTRTRATAPPRSSTTAPTSSTARCTSTRARAGSRTSSGTPTRPAPALGSGATRNLPLPEGTGDDRWLEAVAELADLGRAGCDALVVSLGVDAAADDPESPLQVTADGYREAGRLLGAIGLPSVAVQEGGYHLPTLGGLVAAYLEGHAAASRSAR